MRPVLRGLVAGVFACAAVPVHAQQGSLNITAAAQGLTGDPQRIAGQNAIEPDIGVSWLQPGSRFGTFRMELRGARRTDRLHVGRMYAALSDLKRAGLSWTFEAGDGTFARSIGDYRFSNLTTPAITFSGGAVSVRGSRGTGRIVGGRATAWRNIFGTDPDTLGQTLAVAQGTYRVAPSVEVLGHASRVQTSGLKEFNFTIADSRQAGGGIRYTVLPQLQLIADASLVGFRRVESDRQERDGSILAGANVLLARGWIQVNGSRFSAGEFPALNDALHDRETAFVAGEYDTGARARVFGGFEGLRTNLNPERSLTATRMPTESSSARGFGGVRVQLGAGSTVAVRAERGDSLSRSLTGGTESRNETTSWSGEWQAAFAGLGTYTRFTRRQNVNPTNLDASYTQHDFSTQLFLRLTRTTQLFGLAGITRHVSGSDAGSSYWQTGGGAQLQIPRRNLWVRGEAATSRNVDLLTGEFIPRESYSLGINGQLSARTSLDFNVSADRTPLFFSSGTPWTTRSILRVTQSFSTGSTRVPTAAGVTAAALRTRGTGSVVGTVFTDWNANGVQDPDEGPLENIPVRIMSVSSVSTRRDGEFSFLNVPAGPQTVGLDTSAVPVDFDAPTVSAIDLELERSATRRVSFGLIPLGSIRGRVVRDANANGRVDPDEEPLEDAVLVLDGGARSEQVRKGRYRFDAVRSGDHVVVLVRESLPEGANVTSTVDVPVTLTREGLNVTLDFAVVIEKRPETRRVFPSRLGAPAPAPAPKSPNSPQSPQAAARPPAAAPRAGAGRPAARPAAPPPARPPAAGPAAPPPAARPPAARPAAPPPAARRATPGVAIVPPPPPAPGKAAGAAGTPGYAVQVAALSDPIRARALAAELEAAGYASYLLSPGADDPDGPYRIRVGGYRTRAEAAAAAAALERARQEKLWVIRETTRVGR